MTEREMKVSAVFVAAQSALAPTPGGIQVFTRESHSLLELAGLRLADCLFEPSNGLREKLMRRLDRKPYRYFVPRDLGERVLARCAAEAAAVVVLNGEDLAPLARTLKAARPDLMVVLLSYGLESADYLHAIRAQDGRGDFYRVKESQVSRLGRLLVEEARHRGTIDAVLCMSDVESHLEKWLGAKRVLVVPRLIPVIPFDWSPREGRVGFVGRLDHTPNLEGLRLVLDALQDGYPEGFNVRLVGAPGGIGELLAQRYAFVQYLGVLPAADLVFEARSWACSMNPVFCYARGASTKLAVLLGWGVPVVTTVEGMRGYEWAAGMPTLAATPTEFSAALVDLAFNAGKRNAARAEIERIPTSSVTAAQLALRIGQFLGLPPQTGARQQDE